MSIIRAHSEVLLGQNHSLWNSMMLILTAREIIYTGPLTFSSGSYFELKAGFPVALERGVRG